MSVYVAAVQKGSPAHKAGVQGGWLLLSINGHEIMDVLDYRFYQNDKHLTLCLSDASGKNHICKVKKGEYDETGMEFDTYLMDEQRSCKNKCMFCFIDQMPKGMRESLYFKDDDSRLSFLFGNYITLTNITEHEIQRIINMHISPVNISVHTTNPDLRVKMMRNPNAGRALEVMGRFADAGIQMNAQLVLCPEVNDGAELERSLRDLTAYSTVDCIAVVPVGLTRHRQGLPRLRLFTPEEAARVLDTVEAFAGRCLQECGRRRVFAADEFYLKAGRPIPPAEEYEDFAQLENGVGLSALLKDETAQALQEAEAPEKSRNISCATGVAACGLLREIIDTAAKKWHNLNCKVYAVENAFFGKTITVAGLVTGQDLIAALKDKDLGDELLIPAVMLKADAPVFLDDVTLTQVEQALQVRVTPVVNDGYALIDALRGN